MNHKREVTRDDHYVLEFLQDIENGNTELIPNFQAWRAYKPMGFYLGEYNYIDGYGNGITLFIAGSIEIWNVLLNPQETRQSGTFDTEWIENSPLEELATYTISEETIKTRYHLADWDIRGPSEKKETQPQPITPAINLGTLPTHEGHLTFQEWLKHQDTP